jgi:hypothetical protein
MHTYVCACGIIASAPAILFAMVGGFFGVLLAGVLLGEYMDAYAVDKKWREAERANLAEQARARYLGDEKKIRELEADAMAHSCLRPEPHRWFNRRSS